MEWNVELALRCSLYSPDGICWIGECFVGMTGQLCIMLGSWESRTVFAERRPDEDPWIVDNGYGLGSRVLEGWNRAGSSESTIEHTAT